MLFLPRVLFFCTFFIGFLLFGSLPKANAQGFPIPVLMYHYIRDYHSPKDPTGNQLSVSPNNFGQQMQYLGSHGYTPISLDTMYGILSGKASVAGKPIVLTFDDGYIDFYANAYPILKKYGFHAVSFVPTGFMGRPEYISWNNIQEMQASHLISFEGHTVTHSYLPRMGYNASLKELIDSKNILQQRTGTIVNFMAYPYGAVNATVIRAVQNAGYVGGFGIWAGHVYANSFNMPRVRINGSDSLETFASKL